MPQMKKSILIVTALLAGSCVFAQDLTSKKGEPYLPEAKDWAISIDATPFLNYIGNVFSHDSSRNRAPVASWLNTNNMQITGKYFKDEKTAYRASVRVGFYSTKQVAQIADASQTGTISYPNLPIYKQDIMNDRGHYVGVGFGMEKRKGKTRLQGYYGADAWLFTSGHSLKYEYGNALNSGGGGASQVLPSTGTTTDFGSNTVLASVTRFKSNLNGVTDSYGTQARVTNVSMGQTFGIGVRGFIGAEYFMFPKIALGFEYGWGLGFSTTGMSSYSLESVAGTPTTVGVQTRNISRINKVALDNDINGGGSGSGTAAIKLTLHF
jgi:hypothetical protein